MKVEIRLNAQDAILLKPCDKKDRNTLQKHTGFRVLKTHRDSEVKFLIIDECIPDIDKTDFENGEVIQCDVDQLVVGYWYGLNQC